MFQTPSETDSNPAESLLLVPIDPLNSEPAAAMLSNFLKETQIPAYSLSLISDSANARNTARRDACYNSAVWENVPIKATNSFVAAQKATSHRGRRGDSALTLRQLTNFEDFFELGKDLGLTGAWAEIGKRSSWEYVNSACVILTRRFARCYARRRRLPRRHFQKNT